MCSRHVIEPLYSSIPRLADEPVKAADIPRTILSAYDNLQPIKIKIKIKNRLVYDLVLYMGVTLILTLDSLPVVT